MKPECGSIPTALAWHAAGNSAPAERAEIEFHLERCRDCRDLLAQARLQAELADTGLDLETLLAEPVAPDLLIEYAEQPERLDPDVRREVESKLQRDLLSRSALEKLRKTEKPQPVVERAANVAPFWLRPAAAATYLAAAAVLAGALLLRTPDGAPIVLPGTLVVASERVDRNLTGAPSEAAIPVSGPTWLELRTDLSQEDLADPDLTYRVSLERNGLAQWTETRRGADFRFQPPHAVLSLLVLTERLEREVEYQLVIRAIKPGDPLDRQALFVRRVVVRRPR
jgi:hypothetical protein